MRVFFGALVLSLALASAAAVHADSGGRRPAGRADTSSEYTRAVAAIEAGRFQRARSLLEVHCRRHPRDADGWNWLGYARRKTGAVQAALLAYQRALELDPAHLGAHEYIGEAYLQSGDVASAERHLETLAGLCQRACEQYVDLGRALEAYREQAR